MWTRQFGLLRMAEALEANCSQPYEKMELRDRGYTTKPESKATASAGYAAGRFWRLRHTAPRAGRMLEPYLLA